MISTRKKMLKLFQITILMMQAYLYLQTMLMTANLMVTTGLQMTMVMAIAVTWSV